MDNLIIKSCKIQEYWSVFIRSGNMHSLGKVYNHYFDLLYNYGRKLKFGNQIIEDAIQNVYISIIKSQKQLGNIENLSSYLFCSFRNELFHLCRDGKNTSLDESSARLFVNPDFNQEEAIIESESEINLSSVLARCIGKLTPAQQEILYMRYDANLSYDDISRIVNISVESCRTSVYRAVKSLRHDIESLKKQGVSI